MTKINENFLKLQAGYLFSEIAGRIRAFKTQNPDAKIISLGIGDVTQPLAPVVIEAMKDALDDIDQFTFPRQKARYLKVTNRPEQFPYLWTVYDIFVQ